MSSREKLLLREVDTPTANEIADLEADNDELLKPDRHLQELISNYRKAAEELSLYLEYKKPPDNSSFESNLFKDPIPGEKKFQQKRLDDMNRTVEKKRAPVSGSKEKKNILKNTLGFVKDIFKDNK